MKGWEEMTADEKKKYEEKARYDRLCYERDMQDYNNPPRNDKLIGYDELGRHSRPELMTGGTDMLLNVMQLSKLARAGLKATLKC